MLIKKDQVSLIKNDKVCFIKNFISLEKNYDFNFLSKLMEENYSSITQKSYIGNLQDVFQLHKIGNTLKEFTILFDFFKKLFKYKQNKEDEVDLFFSFVSQVGIVHKDIEDVFIIGLHGKTIYRIYDEENIDYTINKGDLIFIPKNIKHKVIGITPRIIASIGFYGERYI